MQKQTYLTPQQASESLCVTTTTLLNWEQQGKIQSIEQSETYGKSKIVGSIPNLLFATLR